MSKHVGIISDDNHPLLDRICARLQEHGTQASLVNWKSLAHSPQVTNPLTNFDLLYLDRMGERTRTYDTQLNLLIELSQKIAIVNPPESYIRTRNKATMAHQFAKHKIPSPPLSICYTAEQIQSFCRTQSSSHFVAKSVLGCCADDVYPFAATDRELPSSIATLLARDGMVVTQVFVKNSERFIWRVDVVNGEIIVCNQRFAFNSDQETPLCNGTRGGEIVFWNPADLPMAVRTLALNAVKALGLVVAGVDLLPADDGRLFVLEINPEPDITLDRYEFPYAIADHLNSLLPTNENQRKFPHEENATRLDSRGH
jgi:glutathione synthase/RimK-type ligase-like ATP-grasp enzyme